LAWHHRERPFPDAGEARRSGRIIARGLEEEETVAVPLHQMIRVGAYVAKQRLKGVERYPLVLMLEPLFRCNLACAGCGKIDYPDAILNQRLSVAGGEPLLHREIEQIVDGIVARKKFVYLCTNALLMEKKLDRFRPDPYF